MIVTAASNLPLFEKNLQGQDFLNKKLTCEYLSDKGTDLLNYYVMENNSFMIMGENLSVCGKLCDEDVQQLMSFCSFMGIYNLECHQPNLPIKSVRSLTIMRYTAAESTQADNIIKNENIYEFSKFCCNNFSDIAFDTVYSYMARKVNKGFSDLYYMTDDKKIVCGALATGYDSDTVYLTFISTHPDYRNKGLARKLVHHIASQNSQKTILLMCENQLEKFYEKLGFEKYDEIYLYTLREEKI